MKRLCIPALALGFLVALSTMGFTSKRATPPNPASTPSTANHRDVYYYFYDNNDNYTVNATAISEEYRLENIYYVYVDENSIGGDQLEVGYVNPGKPHMGYPDIFLYGHFGN